MKLAYASHSNEHIYRTKKHVCVTEKWRKPNYRLNYRNDMAIINKLLISSKIFAWKHIENRLIDHSDDAHSIILSFNFYLQNSKSISNVRRNHFNTPEIHSQLMQNRQMISNFLNKSRISGWVTTRLIESNSIHIIWFIDFNLYWFYWWNSIAQCCNVSPN